MAAVHPPQQQGAVFEDAGQLYRLIADTIPLMVWTARADGEVDFVNQRVLEYTGLDSRELEGWGWKTVVHPEDWERCAAVWTRALQTGERSENEMRLRRADGEYRWHHGSGVPLRDANGRVVRWFGISTDIEAELRNAQILEGMVEERTRALRESERRFQLFMDHLPAVAWIKDARFRYSYVNRAFERYNDRVTKDVIGRDDFELFPADVARYFRVDDEDVLRAGESVQKLRQFAYADGRPGHWLVVKFPFADASGGMGIAGIAIDVTERSRLEAALGESERKYRALVELSRDAILVRQDGQFVYLNPAALHLFGATEEAEMLGKPVREHVHPDDQGLLSTRENNLERDSGPLAPAQIRLRRVDGSYVITEGTAASVIYNGRRAVLTVIRDITQRIEAEAKARKHAADIRRLLDRLVTAQESERRRVADELHDLIGQNLTAFGIDLQALKQRLQASGDLIAGPRLDAMAGLVETTIDAIRGVMTDLRPAALEEFGLVPALRWYASQFSKRTGMKVSTNVSGRELRLSQDTELALFRIVQEALTNAAKHSGGTMVEITVASHDGGLRLTVEDDGRGFADPVGARSARRGGFGLPTMRERAEAHGGVLRIEFPGRGTRLIVEMHGNAD